VIVFDTNVFSELLRPAPEPTVRAWVASKPRSALFTTTITRAEILYGIALMPDGRRRHALLACVERVFDEIASSRETRTFSRLAASMACRFSYPWIAQRGKSRQHGLGLPK